MQPRFLPEALAQEELNTRIDSLNGTTANVREKRFHYDHTLFLTGRVLQSFTVFNKLFDAQQANFAINVIFVGIDFNTLSTVAPLTERDQALMKLHNELIFQIKSQLGAHMAMSDFFSLGQMELLYRYRSQSLEMEDDVRTGIPLVDIQLEHIARLLRQDIDGEPGKPGLAEEIFHPEKPHDTIATYTHNGKTIVEIARVEKFYSETHTALTSVQIQEYRDLLNGQIEKPFWFTCLSAFEQRYLLADLNGMTDAQINQKYGNTSAKGRKYPGLSGLRRKTIGLYERQANGTYRLVDQKEPAPHHFTSAGSPVNLQSQITDEQVEFAAKNIARMLSVVWERRLAWVQENFQRNDIGMEAVYLIITSLVSPLGGQGKLVDFLTDLVSDKTADILKENNEEMIVRTLKRAVDHINRLAATGDLASLNPALAPEAPQHFICDLAIFGINKFGKWLSLQSRKSLYQTGPMTAFHALTYDVQLFIHHGGNRLPQSCLQAIYQALTALDFSRGMADLDRKTLEILNEQQTVLAQNADPRMKRLARRLKAALMFLKIVTRSDMKIIAAAMFEKINPGTTYAACKSSHDRKEHLDLVSEAIDMAEWLLEHFPDPTQDADMQLLAKIVLQKKFIVQSASASRALSANNIGLKSHDSVGVFTPYWRGHPIGALSAKFTAAAVQGDFLGRNQMARNEDNEDDNEVRFPFCSSVLNVICQLPKRLFFCASVNELTEAQQFRQALYALVQYEKPSNWCLSQADLWLFIIWTGVVFGISYDRLNPEHFVCDRGFDTTVVWLSFWVFSYYGSMVTWFDKRHRHAEACAFLNQHVANPAGGGSHERLLQPQALQRDNLERILTEELYCTDTNKLLSKYFTEMLNTNQSLTFSLMKWVNFALKKVSFIFLEGLLAYACLAIISALSQHNLALAFPIASLVFMRYFFYQHTYLNEMSEKCAKQVAVGGVGPKVLQGADKICLFRPNTNQENSPVCCFRV